jgi:hypothetical protein
LVEFGGKPESTKSASVKDISVKAESIHKEETI